MQKKYRGASPVKDPIVLSDIQRAPEYEQSVGGVEHAVIIHIAAADKLGGVIGDAKSGAEHEQRVLGVDSAVAVGVALKGRFA